PVAVEKFAAVTQLFSLVELGLSDGIGVCERQYAHEIVVMSFSETLDNLALKKSELVERFEHLITPKSDPELEAMAQPSRSLTLQNFGRPMRLFAPLYLSNECVNNCRYCGFSRDNPILRVTLDVDEVVAEAQHLASGISSDPTRRG